jgi:catechol 2,3-dioxygenase-like lactoylglutathione lyase family enzyme
MFEAHAAPRLNQVTLPTVDIARATAFYRVLGLIPIVQSEHYARFVVPGNEATLSVHLVDDLPYSPTVVYLECDDLDATVADLERAGVVFEEPPIDRRWRWREARLRDPDGNPLCLYRAGDDRLNPPWRVEASKGRHRLSPERFRAWLDRLAQGGRDRNGAAVGDLFAAGAAPIDAGAFPGGAGGRFDVVHVHADVGLARWRNEAGEDEAMLEVGFDRHGRASRCRSWWRTRG